MVIAGPLQLFCQGNVYLLSIVDVFSRNVALVPLRSTDSLAIIKSFQRKWVSHYGYPETISTDGASYFTSYETESYFSRKNIIHHVSSPYHPQSNGLVERYFFTIKDMVYASSQEKKVDWDTVLWEVELGLRSSTQQATGKSPFKIIYGFSLLSKSQNYENKICLRRPFIHILVLTFMLWVNSRQQCMKMLIQVMIGRAFIYIINSV